MPERKIRLEVANLHLTYGRGKDKNGELLNYFLEIVLPAFRSKDPEPFYNSNYILDSVKFTRIENEPVVYGRLVRDFKLQREQVWRGKIVEDTANMETAPTSMFVLMLRNHRLLWVREMEFAPTTANFRAVMLRHFHREWDLYLNSLVGVEDEDGDIWTKKSLKAALPAPYLKILPLQDTAGLDVKLARFSKITSLEFRFVQTNAETLDLDPFFTAFQNKSIKLGVSNSKVEYRDPKGLVKQQVIEEVVRASNVRDGTIEVTAKGKDKHQTDIEYDNTQECTIRKEVDIGGSPGNRAQKMVEGFHSLVSDGVVRDKDPGENGAEQMKEIDDALGR